MARRIVRIHIDEGLPKHARHISKVKWVKDSDVLKEKRTRSVAQVIKRIKEGKKYYVKDKRTGQSAVVSIATREGREYIRTQPDDDKFDNLLALKTF